MTDTELREANEIKKEIDELNSFIFSAERVWEGKIIKRESKFIFKSIGYGVIDSAKYEMNTEMKNRMLDLLRERLVELENRLADM